MTFVRELEFRGLRLIVAYDGFGIGGCELDWTCFVGRCRLPPAVDLDVVRFLGTCYFFMGLFSLANLTDT
jgi:hypothetical protein